MEPPSHPNWTVWFWTVCYLASPLLSDKQTRVGWLVAWLADTLSSLGGICIEKCVGSRKVLLSLFHSHLDFLNQHCIGYTVPLMRWCWITQSLNGNDNGITMSHQTRTRGQCLVLWAQRRCVWNTKLSLSVIGMRNNPGVILLWSEIKLSLNDTENNKFHLWLRASLSTTAPWLLNLSLLAAVPQGMFTQTWNETLSFLFKRIQYITFQESEECCVSKYSFSTHTCPL